MKPRIARACLAVCLLCAIAAMPVAATASEGAGRDYYRIVTLADLHLPGRNVGNKLLALKTMNSWPDVDYVALLGDMVADVGNSTEYEYMLNFVAKFEKPILPIVGNHDYIYLDVKNRDGGRERGMYTDRQKKLEVFRQAFGVERVYYSMKLEPYLLVFLSCDDLYSSYLARLSSEQIEWLEAELESHKQMPTIIFFHSPLKGTIARGGNNVAVKPDFHAQPVQTIHDILAANHQVIAWVSGHTHTAPTNRNFYDPAITMYDGRVLNIHTPDTNGSSFLSERDYDTTKHNDVWINSLYLYPNKVVIRTYDVVRQRWLEHLDREILAPSA